MAEIKVIKKVETQVSAEEKAEKLDVIAHALHLPIYHVENFIRLAKTAQRQKPDTFPMLLRSIFDNTYIPIINWKAYNSKSDKKDTVGPEGPDKKEKIGPFGAVYVEDVLVMNPGDKNFYILSGDVEVLGIYLQSQSESVIGNFMLVTGCGRDKQFMFAGVKNLENIINAIYDYKEFCAQRIVYDYYMKNVIVVKFPEIDPVVAVDEAQAEYVPSKKLIEFMNFIGKSVNMYESTNLYELNDFWIPYQKYMYSGEVPQQIQPIIKIQSAAEQEKRFKEAFLNNIYYQKFGAPMPETVSAKEKNIIENEFARQMKYRAQILGSKCSHWDIEKDFRHAVNEIDKMHAYHKLEKFMTMADRKVSLQNKTPQNYIKCTNCKLDMICPHVRDEHILSHNKKPKNENDNYLHNHIFKYAGEAKIADAYYCMVCGEAITYNIKMEGFDAFVRGNRVHQTAAEDALYEYLTSAITYILSTVVFTGVQSSKFINSFIKTAADVLIDYIAAQEKIINKSKTSTQEESDAKKQLFTDIYIYAFLLKVLNDNPKAFTFKLLDSQTKNKNAKNAKKQNNFAAVSALIISSRNIIINKLNLDSELIQKSLFKAYKLIDSHIKSSKIVHTKSHAIISPDINPVINYTNKIQSLPQSNRKNMSGYEKYYYDSYDNFVKYGKTFAVPLYITTLMDNNRPTFTLHPNYISIFEMQTEFLNTERKITEEYKKGIRRVFMLTPQSVRVDVQSNNNLLLQKYGVTDKFHVHNWETYYYSSMGGQLKKYKIKEFTELDYSEQRKLIIVDAECGICGRRRSELIKEKNQLEELENVSEFKNFTNYYENKCPEGNTHEFNEKNICKLCKYDRSEPITQSYYKKYKSQFIKDTHRKKSHLSSKPFATPDEVVKTTKKYYTDLNAHVESYVNWRFNNNIINEFIQSTSTILEKKHNLKRANYTNFIMNLGLTEGYDFNDILSGKENPHHKLSEDPIALLRIQRLETYIHEFLISQNILRNYATMSSIPPDLEPVISSLNATQKQTKNKTKTQKGGKPSTEKKPKKKSEKKQPKTEKVIEKSVAADYYGALEKMKVLYYSPGNYEKLSNFMYDALLKLILRVVRDNNMPQFVSYVLERIYESEKGLSKMKEKQAVQISAAQIGYDANNDNLVDNTATKDYDGLVTEADLQKTIYSEIDYDGEND